MIEEEENALLFQGGDTFSFNEEGLKTDPTNTSKANTFIKGLSGGPSPSHQY